VVIQNRKTGRQENVSPNDWQKIKDLGFESSWIVISKEDVKLERKTIPKAIVDFNETFKKHGTKGSGTLPGDKDVQLDGDGSEGKTV
jgi:hypothetical protein